MMDAVFLDSLVNGLAHTGMEWLHKVKTLVIENWSSLDWGKEHTQGVIQICHRFDIEHVRFCISGNLPTNFMLERLEIEGKKEIRTTCAFFQSLKTLAIEDNHRSLIYWHLLRNSRIKTLRFLLQKQENLEDAIAEAKSLLIHLDDCNIIGRFNSIRTFEIRWLDKNCEQIDLSTYIDDSQEEESLDLLLADNRDGWKRCLDATTVLLGLKRRRAINVDRNVLSMVIGIVWETRGTKVWLK
jgi:hypothetical protein